jgi:hypothetical protein
MIIEYIDAPILSFVDNRDGMGPILLLRLKPSVSTEIPANSPDWVDQCRP